MGSGGEANFTVTVIRKEVVAAVLPLQEHWLPLSNLDLLLPPLDVGVFLCYKSQKDINPMVSFGSMVGVLKKAMAQVLVSYYAFAGEVVANPLGEPELLCNNRGVDFSEAFADIELKDLNFYNPDESVEGKLVPRKKNGVLSVQATELKCGGLVVACTFDHRIADAYSTNMFLVSWAETAQSKPISILPSFRRSLLSPRLSAGCFDPSIDEMFVPISSFLPPKDQPEANPDDHLISRIYYVKAHELTRLQSLASSNGYKRTKLESFSAFLWQLIAKCASNEENSTTERTKISKMGIVVDGRSRLSDKTTPEKAIQMATYFGNVLSLPYVCKRVEELTELPLSRVANNVHNCLEKAATKEHFWALIDWVEAHRPVSVVAKIYTRARYDGPAFVISSGQRFPVSKLDFGWGVPVFGSYHFPWGGNTGYVMPMTSPGENGDWVLYMHLFREQLEFLEAEAAHFFKPLNCDDYLNQ
ncbi:hypothetical protein P3X46_012862 [Hevea brasiliensis]|uniref:Uncharacterized protein n=1 Tax=Hevea brasiliensis TaxID=3981 RepID=A0ABQ9MFA7_HEVBR|nr:coniferyl alcohol acyltransferase [Hevea brasiliensis]KAJ9177670.1 hypothetical protein P3X46_012862 [Hevea brasiliensis]